MRSADARRGMGTGMGPMYANLVWRTILFFALTLGYAMVSALPYLV